MRRLLVATFNPGKIREISAALAPTGIEVLGLDTLEDRLEIEETGATFEENARLKARYYAARSGLWTVAEDSGLGVLRGTGSGRRAEEWISGLGVDLGAFQYDLLITKANARSSIHRPAYLDCVAIKQRDEQGNVVGLYCLIGLFSSGAYSTPPRQMPLDVPGRMARQHRRRARSNPVAS